MSDYAFLNTAIGVNPITNHPLKFGNLQQPIDSIYNQSDIDRFERQTPVTTEPISTAPHPQTNEKKSNALLIFGGLALGAGLIAIFHKPIGKFLGIGKAKNLGNATPNLTSGTKKVFDAVESEKLGMDYVEKYMKDSQKTIMKNQPANKNMTDAEFENIWLTKKNELLRQTANDIENTFLKQCIDKGGKGGNFGFLGFKHPSRDSYIQFAETLANKQGYTIVNIRETVGLTGFDLAKM